MYVVPRSSRTEIIGIHDNALKIKLKSPPVDNEANEELTRFLAKKLSISRSSVEIIKGHNQKRKIISLTECNAVLIKSLLGKGTNLS